MSIQLYRNHLVAAAALLAASSAFAQIQAPPQSNPTAERLSQIVHDYILAHPEVILESIRAFNERAQSEAKHGFAKMLDVAFMVERASVVFVRDLNHHIATIVIDQPIGQLSHAAVDGAWSLQHLVLVGIEVQQIQYHAPLVQSALEQEQPVQPFRLQRAIWSKGADERSFARPEFGRTITLDAAFTVILHIAALHRYVDRENAIALVGVKRRNYPFRVGQWVEGGLGQVLVVK